MTESLAAALEDYRPGEYPWRDDEPVLEDVVEGDVLVVSDMDGRRPNRMVVALDVEPERRCFFGAFVTNERSLASAEDVDLAPDQTGLPYHIAGLAGLKGWIWYVQIRRRLGALTDEALNAVSAGHLGVEDAFQSAHRGVALQAPRSDLRWPALTTEAEYVRDFTWDCDEKHSDDDIALPFVDPRLFPVFGNSLDESTAKALDDLVKATRAGRTRGVSPSCVEQLVATLDGRSLMAYRSLLTMRSAAISPPQSPDGGYSVNWLLDLTRADGLSQAPFVKVIGSTGSPVCQLLENNGRSVEYLYATL